LSRLDKVWRKASRRFLGRRDKSPKREKEHVYYYRHPIAWWNQFSDVADIQIATWAFFSPTTQKALIPDNALGRKLFEMIFWAEDRLPHRLAERSRYPIIILTKKPGSMAMAIPK
jgi:hypothetical protein